VDAALTREVATARRDLALLLVLQAHRIATQTLEQKVLEIEHIVTSVAGRWSHQPQSLRMPIEKIGMLAQVGDDVAGADRARLRRQGAAGAGRLWLVLRAISHG
jgi:hypothetical protein